MQPSDAAPSAAADPLATTAPPAAAAPPGADRIPRYRRQKLRQGPLPLTTKLFQGIGSLVGSHKDFAFNTLLMLYYNQILGVPASAASLVLAISLAIDAITDPLVGAFSDNIRSKLGRRHPLMYIAAVPMGVFIYLLFSPPSGAGTGFLIGWLLTMTLLVRLAFTLFHVPWSALAAEFTSDYVERTSIVTWRHLVGWLGGVVFMFTILSTVFAATDEQPVGQLNPDAYPVFALIAGTLMTFWCLLTTHLTRREIPYLLQPDGPAGRIRIADLSRQVLLSLKSANFRLVLLSFLLFSGLAGVGGVFDMFMNTFFWGFVAEDLRWFVLTIVGAVSAFILVVPLQQRFEKHQIMIVSLTGVMLLGMLKVTLRFAEVLPDNGDPMLLVVLVAHGSLVVFCLTVAAIIFASMIADLVDEQELRIGYRQEGVFSSAIGFCGKATSSLGLILGGLLLDYVIAFPRGVDPNQVGADVLFRLAVVDGIAVNALFVVPIYLVGRYTLTRAVLADVQRRLAGRHN